MRVLVVTNMYPPHHYGGYELSCRDVVERWRSAGHDVLVLTSELRVPGVPAAIEEDTFVRRVLPIAFAAGDLVDPPLRRRLDRERAAQRHLTDALAWAPDVVSIWHMGALPLTLLTTLCSGTAPLVYVVCDDWLTYGPDVDPWMRMFVDRPRVGRLAERLTGVPAHLPDLGRSGIFLFVSELTRRRSNDLSRWRYPRSTVTYSGIDTGDFPVSEPNRAPWRGRLLQVGRLDPRKGTATALRALPRVPGATLDVIGRGGPAYERELHELARSLGVEDRVSFRVVPRDELAAVYRDADAVLFPVEWEEPFGLVPVEAMACGTPVVATAMGGSAEFLVDGWNCLRVPAGDPAALARAVQRLEHEPDLGDRLRAGGRRTATQLTVDALADVLEDWHAAAAARFAEGCPPHRVLDLPGRRDPLARHRADAADVIASGDPRAVKRLYTDLSDYWEEAHGHDPDDIPVLSAPETHAVVAGLVDGVDGLVLDAGCGPRPALSVAVARAGSGPVVALDMGVGTVRLAREAAGRAGVSVLGVVGDVEELPFRAHAFSAVVCEDTIEHVPDHGRGVAELARVVDPGGRVVLATPNRWSGPVLKQKALDRLRGRVRPPADYFVSSSHLREYTWRELEALVRPVMSVRRRVGVGWHGGGWKRRVVSRLVWRGPGRRLGQMIVVELAPRSNQPAYSASNRAASADQS